MVEKLLEALIGKSFKEKERGKTWFGYIATHTTVIPALEQGSRATNKILKPGKAVRLQCFTGGPGPLLEGRGDKFGGWPGSSSCFIYRMGGKG
jgi:hypothetical protein